MSNAEWLRESIVSTIMKTARFRREMAAAPASRQDRFLSSAAAQLLEELADHVHRAPEYSEISAAIASLERADGEQCHRALKQAGDYASRVGFTELVDAAQARLGLARAIRGNPDVAEQPAEGRERIAS